LPSEKYFKEYALNSFVFYKPKDIVAGDFYWLEKKNNLLFLAVADCTGHGVPGAMGSVLCSNALNRSLLEFGFTDPGKILDKTRELIVDTFSKSEKEVKDGMDISLLSINMETLEINWAGANNPLSFTTHKIKLNKNDMLFLFTDGFADQFGGEKGKKFKYKPLKELLTNNAHLQLKEQKQLLLERFENWRGNLDQVDDVCVVGIKL
jgi:serine phosphatase RsbU (regulator of sigma subunit)